MLSSAMVPGGLGRHSQRQRAFATLRVSRYDLTDDGTGRWVLNGLSGAALTDAANHRRREWLIREREPG